MKEFKRNGYTLSVKENGNHRMYRVTHDQSSRYKPEIYIDDYSDEPKVVVQTTSYGGLTVEEMTELIEQLNRATTTAKSFEHILKNI